MARYAKVDRRIWNDARFRSLSERGKLVFLFALTHPSLTMLGAMRATVPGLAAELEVTFEAFQEALQKGIVKHDSKASCLWLPNFLRYNRPESPNVVRAWPEAFDLIPECDLKYQLFEQLKGFVEGLSEGFREAFAEAFPKDYAEDYTESVTVTVTEEKTLASSSDEQVAGVVFELPLKDGSSYGVPQDLYAEYCKSYPANVNVMEQLGAMRAWLLSNPGKRKTRAGIKAFINGWLKREQDNPNDAPRKRPLRTENFDSIDYAKSYGLAPGENVGRI